MTRKTTLSEGLSWFKFHKLGLALGMALKTYTSVPKVLKLKVRKFLGLIPKFVEVTGEKLVGRFLPPLILNRVKAVVVILKTIYISIRTKCLQEQDSQLESKSIDS